MEPRSEIPGDKSRVSLVIVWFLFLAAVLSVCARLGTKYGMARRLAADDVLIIIAQATSLAQCIAISFGAKSGLGASMNDLSSGQVDEVLKAEYASTPFLLLTLALVKWSICVFINQLSPNAIHRHVDLAFRLTIGLWLVSATVISVFQCGLPKPWDYIHRNSCTDRRSWCTYASVLNMITELGFVFLYVWIIGRLHISVLKRTTVLLVFLTRLFVIGAAAAQLAIFWIAYSNPDITAGLWLPTVCNQVVVLLSVLTACLPYLRPLMESLESGIVHVPDEVEELRSFARAGSRSTWPSTPS
ncbi:hypothetical protein KVR01_009624 [Diaporthe batatas]|uniref:uncharacterized protein n=1 Tax=Diaporthe batatas TaxID=748121 RepID=UPI001D042140|nr:uncharacterized protein KVR01_009624 [Diaporthe batatas]KAG8161360.1 hypothetical protein KVR01_009624 [Diaporthe batatas]